MEEKRVEASSGLGTSFRSEFRSGKCPDCGGVLDEQTKESKPYRYCPVCKKMTQGKLITTMFTVSEPIPPKCASFKCLLKFVVESVTYSLIRMYHVRRIEYAVKNRNKEILERYRTGEPSPKTLWQALHANIKLTCPVCRKFNVDPLLFSGGK